MAQIPASRAASSFTSACPVAPPACAAAATSSMAAPILAIRASRVEHTIESLLALYQDRGGFPAAPRTEILTAEAAFRVLRFHDHEGPYWVGRGARKPRTPPSG